MEWLLAVAGLLLLATIMADLVKTTLTLQGAGPLTSRAAKLGWSAVKRLDRRRPRKRLMSYAGSAITLLAVAGWLLGQWIAWTVVFSAGTMVVESTTGAPAGFWERVYYVGYSIFTLGVGGYAPANVAAQIATNVAAAIGFLTISLSATYFIPTVAAAATKRQLAIHISGIGRTPEEILARTWNGRDFGQLGQHLSVLTPTIIAVGQHHLAYPVLHYYHSEDLDAAITIRLAALDEAVAIVEAGIAPECRLPDASTRVVANGIGSYYGSLRRLAIEPAAEAPPLPLLDPLRRRGIPVVSDEAFRGAMEHRRFRRRIARSLVEDSGRTWDDVLSM